jgi:peptidoglycan/xylan/chitin deacetylase (PgdA/CDA1 family)
LEKIKKKLGRSTRAGGKDASWRRSYRNLKLHLMGTLTHINTDSPVAALSFDDGPHENYTPALLEILKKHNVLATFFMVGQAASQYPELVRQVHQAGHAIGNHTFRHTALPGLGIWKQIREIRMCQRVLRPYGCNLLRPPWGKQTNASRLVALLLGYKVIAWNLSAEDWCDHSSASMADRLVAGLRPGSIVLMHDRVFTSAMEKPQYDRSASLKAIELLLEKVKGRVRFVTVPQLMEYGNPHYVIWKRLI